MPHDGIMRTTVNNADHLLVEAEKVTVSQSASLTAILENSPRL